jgi:hypothetical protein
VHAAYLPVYRTACASLRKSLQNFFLHSASAPQVKLEEASQKPYDFNSREHKPEGFKKESLKWWKDVPQLVQRIDDFWNSWVGHGMPR